jgi:hypothetical protein
MAEQELWQQLVAGGDFVTGDVCLDVGGHCCGTSSARWPAAAELVVSTHKGRDGEKIVSKLSSLLAQYGGATLPDIGAGKLIGST